jgi:hypothetical protein
MDAGQVETVQATLPGYEATSSLAATFRSVYSPKEPAGFSKVAGLVRSRSLAEADGASARLETIRLWTRGVSTLRKRQAEQLAAEKLGWPYPPLIGGKRPDEIIRIYLYGEYLHWDQARGADQLASWQADPFSEAFSGCSSCRRSHRWPISISGFAGAQMRRPEFRRAPVRAIGKVADPHHRIERRPLGV